MRKTSSWILAAALIGGLTGVTGPASGDGSAACASPDTPGGDWPLDGGQLSGTRAQLAEDTISRDNVATLTNAWTFPIPAAWGQMSTVPIVAEGCIYLQTSYGTSGEAAEYQIIAINAVTGALVWNYPLVASGAIASPHVVDGVVYVNHPTNHTSTGKGPHVLALDSQTGELIFAGEGVCTEAGCANNAGATSPALYVDGMVWIGITNSELDFSRGKVGGFALVDAEDGSLIKRTRNLAPDSITGGCAIWGAPAYDEATKYAYAGTGQPSPWLADDATSNCNAIIKMDLAKARDEDGNPVESAEITNPTFGEIVDRMKGTPDSAAYPDVDFGGAGATLVTDDNGRQIVVAQQKSSWIHAAYTDDMSNAWSMPNGYGYFIGPITKTATDGKNIFTAGGTVGYLWSYDATALAPGVTTVNWAQPSNSPQTQGNLAYANGVTYWTDSRGFLNAYNSDTGVPLFSQQVLGCTNQSNRTNNVSVAYNTVYASCQGRLAAYKLPVS